MSDDTYRMLSAPAEGLYKEKGSKFIAIVEAVESEEDIKSALERVRTAYHDARHVCYAWKLGPTGEHLRANDDGEPSGSAGKPILGQLDSFDVTNALAMVVRYFGGTKLGVGGLVTAYKSATADALQQATIVERTVNAIYEAEFRYDDMNYVMRTVKDYDLNLIDQDFQITCKITFAVRLRDSETVASKLQKLPNLELKYLRTE